MEKLLQKPIRFQKYILEVTAFKCL